MPNSFYSPFLINKKQAKAMLDLVIGNLNQSQLVETWDCSEEEAETAIHTSSDNLASQEQVLAAFLGLMDIYNEREASINKLSRLFALVQIDVLFRDIEVMDIIKQLNAELKDGETVFDLNIPEGKILVKDSSDTKSVYKYAYSHESVFRDGGWENITRYYLLGNSCDSPQQIERTFNRK